MANLVADFLPASFNNTTSFPIAARNAGVTKYWNYEGGKKGSVARMFKLAYQDDPRRLLAVVKEIVDLGLGYRSRGDKEPINREEIERLNELLLKLGLRIKSFNEPDFLLRLPRKSDKPKAQSPTAAPPVSKKPDAKACAELKAELLRIGSLAPHDRGYSFEKFLNQLFKVHGMSPNSPFRNRGEQIDGSFIHRYETFLLEAKWQAPDVAIRDLYTFASKVETKAAWARGLFVSQSGFTQDGLFAFRQGKPTSIVCMDGIDLFLLLDLGLELEDVLDRKMRSAVETGRAFVAISDLFSEL
jgi:hypothetical protein